MSSISAVNQRKRTNVMIPDHVCGALVFVFTEIMFYSALISALVVMRRGRDSWGQSDAQALPALAEGFNGLVLALSAASVYLALRAYARQPAQARAHLFRATGLAFLFVVYQIVLGWKLHAGGVTLNSSVFAGSLYLIFGSHLLQALVGFGWIAVLALNSGNAKPGHAGSLRGLAVFWISIFAIWPVIYGVFFI